jgi:hypothetical protein
MLIAARFRTAIEDGSVTLTFRRWKRCQVVAGHRYRTAAGRIEVDAVDVVNPQRITNADAVKAGFPNKADLLAELRGTDELPIYRIRFHAYRGADERGDLQRADALTPDDLADIDRRLARLDRASTHGPWTMAVLRAIDERPRTRAGDLATTFDRDTQPFKLDVRKLKTLGLTLSHEVGYELSPRGRAYWNARRHLA